MSGIFINIFLTRNFESVCLRDVYVSYRWKGLHLDLKDDSMFVCVDKSRGSFAQSDDINKRQLMSFLMHKHSLLSGSSNPFPGRSRTLEEVFLLRPHDSAGWHGTPAACSSSSLWKKSFSHAAEQYPPRPGRTTQSRSFPQLPIKSFRRNVKRPLPVEVYTNTFSINRMFEAIRALN